MVPPTKNCFPFAPTSSTYFALLRYQGWKSLFPPQVAELDIVRAKFNQALHMMSQALSDQPIMQVHSQLLAPVPDEVARHRVAQRERNEQEAIRERLKKRVTLSFKEVVTRFISFCMFFLLSSFPHVTSYRIP